MCGICGEFIFDGRAAQVEPAVLQSMMRALTHRGPDGDGWWISPDRRVGLGHTRLKILDLSDAGRQPMANEDESLQLTFNGEIYNFAALRRRLEAAHPFRSRTDTETILHAYEEEGPNVLQALEGMFAFGLWDGARRRLLLARDRAGKKPLYYTLLPDRLVFASEVKALLRHPLVGKVLLPEAVDRYFTFAFVPAPLTMFRGIFKLPAAHALQIGSDGDAQLERYWSPAVDPAVETLEETAVQERIIATLREAVRKRLVADVPVAVFLSGGLDSSLVTALAAEEAPRPLTTFSVGYDRHFHNDDLAYARRTAQRYGTRHVEVVVSTEEAFGRLDALVEHYDDLVNDSAIPFAFLSERAHAEGFKVVLIGEGSDEVFSGYPFLGSVYRYQQWLQPLRRAPELVRQAAVGGLAPLLRACRRHFPAEMLTATARGDELFWGMDVLFRYGRRERLFAPSFAGEVADTTEPASLVRGLHDTYARGYGGGRTLARWAYVELNHHLPDYLLARVDKGAMQFSVECRAPYLDQALLDLSVSLPDHLKWRGGEGKFILKQAAAPYLPQDLIYRPKRPLPVPYVNWLQEGALDVCSGLRDDDPVLNAACVRQLQQRCRAGQTYFADKLWAVYLFRRWHQQWFGR